MSSAIVLAFCFFTTEGIHIRCYDARMENTHHEVCHSGPEGPVPWSSEGGYLTIGRPDWDAGVYRPTVQTSYVWMGTHVVHWPYVDVIVYVDPDVIFTNSFEGNCTKFTTGITNGKASIGSP